MTTATKTKKTRPPGKWWDKAWSLVDGCTPVSEACDHCWLREMDHRFGNDQGPVRFREDRLDIPLKRKKPTVWAVWSDLFHEAVAWNEQFKAFQMMAASPHHSFVLLTKRPVRMVQAMDDITLHLQRNGVDTALLGNVYLGTTIENQQRADERMPYLMKLAAMGWNTIVSYEPALGSVDFSPWLGDNYSAWAGGFQEGCKAVICGGESGHGARPMRPDWARKVKDDCDAAGVDFYFKQWGEWAWIKQGPKNGDGEVIAYRAGKKNAGRLLDGREYNALPWEAGE